MAMRGAALPSACARSPASRSSSPASARRSTSWRPSTPSASRGGTTVQEINKLLKMHQEMSTAMKRLKKMGGLGKLAAMFSKGGLEGALGGIAPPGALPGSLPSLGGAGASLPGLGGGSPFNLPPG